MKYVSLFAGIGGFDLALNRLGHECVYVNEWDKYAAAIYEKNFGYKPDTRSITDVSSDDIPEHDLLVGGFPCQAFSIAGKRRGFQDIRGTLFYEIIRIAKAKRTKFLLLENVKGLLNHAGGATFHTILNTLDELGYNLQWQVCNSKDFGVPQNRERVFIIGHIRGERRPQIFPIVGEEQKDTRHLGTEVSLCLDANYYKGVSDKGFQSSKRQLIGTLRTHKDGNGFREIKSGISPTIPARAREDGSGQPVIAMPMKFLKRNQKNLQGEYSFTIDGANTGGIMQDMRIRRLTPVECERLQGFPDNWTKYSNETWVDNEGNSGNRIISDTQRYKCLGNAVTVNVVEAIMGRFMPNNGGN